MSRIEQLISDIESYIDTCKYYPLSNVKIIVMGNLQMWVDAEDSLEL